MHDNKTIVIKPPMYATEANEATSSLASSGLAGGTYLSGCVENKADHENNLDYIS